MFASAFVKVPGTVMKVSGPLVVAENMSGTKMYEAGHADSCASLNAARI